MISEEMIVEYIFASLAFRLPWQPIKFSGLEKFVCLVEDYPRNISKNLCPNICNEIEIKTYFHFSHNNSVETINCPSDEST